MIGPTDANEVADAWRVMRSERREHDCRWRGEGGAGARAGFDMLPERGPLASRIHLGDDVEVGLQRLTEAVEPAVG